MAQVVVYGTLDQAGYAALERAEFRHARVPAYDTARLCSELADAEALILRHLPLNRAAIQAAPGLRVLSLVGSACDNIDMEAVRASGIVVATTGDVSARTWAEHTLALMLAAAKQVVRFDRATRSGNYAVRESIDSLELYGKKVLIIGFGKVGRNCAKLCQAFGMEVHVLTRSTPTEEIEACGYVQETDIETALAGADVVSLHLPGEGNAEIINRRRIGLIKQGAILVNTASGVLLDEEALNDAVASGHLFAAAVDIFPHEPIHRESLSLRHPRIVLSPYNSAVTREYMSRLCKTAVENAIALLRGDAEGVQVLSE